MNLTQAEVKKALEIIIQVLDEQMQEAPNRTLADISNYLEELKAKL